MLTELTRQVSFPFGFRWAVEMFRLHALPLASLRVMIGCPRQPLPAKPTPPVDQADLEARYDRLEVGIPEPEIAAFMGKPGARVAGYTTPLVKSKPQEGGEMVASE